MNKILNDKGQEEIAVGAPGSIARVTAQYPALIERLNALHISADGCIGRCVDQAVEMIRAAGITSPLETNSLLSASHYGEEPSGSVTSLVMAVSQSDVSTKQKFVTRYAANMAADSDAHPGRYVVPPKGWLDLAERMTEGLLRGTANLSDVARKTIKQLGGKPTYAGFKSLLAAP